MNTVWQIFISLSIFLAMAIPVKSQTYLWDIGVSGGGSMLVGDIGGTEKTKNWGTFDVALKNTRFATSVFGRRFISYRFYANFQANYTYLYAHDKNSPNTGREGRNLSFFNNLYEGLAMIEYHPIIIHDLGGKSRYLANLNVYVSTGAGLLYQNPKAVINGQSIYLQPLNTEGPGKSYSNWQFVLPVSIGSFVTFKGKKDDYKTHRVGFSINYRFTYFDYLDDVSTSYPDISVFGDNQLAIDASYRGTKNYPNKGSKRGSPGANDHYFTVMFSYSKRLLSNKKSNTSRRMDDHGKPKKRKR